MSLMRTTLVIACALVLWVGLPGSEAGASQTSVTLPARGAFYYPWFAEAWTQQGFSPFTRYTPTLGFYSSSTQSVVDEHISALEYAHVDVGIASWWGVGTHSESLRMPQLFDRTVALGASLKWAFYYEKEGNWNPTVAEIQSDLAHVSANYTGHSAYAHVNGKPVIFVYNSLDTTCEVAARWSEATAGAWYVVLLVFPGYRSCPIQPDSWHQYGPASAERMQSPYAFSISPGFWRPDEATPRLARDLARWHQNIRNMIASQMPWQLVTTFNEWGEGTAVERSTEWGAAPYGEYIEALHDDGLVPTAVAFESRSASRARVGVLVRWRTGSEARVLGFNLYRERSGRRTKLNRAVIPSARSGASGNSYSWLDRTAPGKSGLRYWLEEVGVTGARGWHGPIVVS